MEMPWQEDTSLELGSLSCLLTSESQPQSVWLRSQHLTQPCPTLGRHDQPNRMRRGKKENAEDSHGGSCVSRPGETTDARPSRSCRQGGEPEEGSHRSLRSTVSLRSCEQHPRASVKNQTGKWSLVSAIGG